MLGLLASAVPVVLGLVLLLLAAGAAYARRFLPAERLRREQLRLHRELAAANRLTDAESELLWQLSRGARVDKPAHLFVRPTVFDERVAAVGAEPALAKAVRQKLWGDAPALVAGR